MKKVPRLKREVVAYAMANLPEVDAPFRILGHYQNEYGIEIEYTFSTEQVRDALERYATFSFFHMENENASAGEAFMRIWNNWLSIKLRDLNYLMKAYYKEYNPADNYDMREESADGIKRGNSSTTHTGTDSSSSKTVGVSGERVGEIEANESFGGYEETQRTNRNGLSSVGDGVRSDTVTTTRTGNPDTTTIYHDISNPPPQKHDDLEFSEDALTYYGKSGAKSTIDYTKDTTDTTTHENALSMDAAGGNKDTSSRYDETNTHYMTRKGNIGVTTTQQMIESEFALRTRNILDEFIKGFAVDNLVYISYDNDSYEDDYSERGCYYGCYPL